MKKIFNGTNIEINGANVGVAFAFDGAAKVYAIMLKNGQRNYMKVLDSSGRHTIMPKILLDPLACTGRAMAKFVAICTARIKRQLTPRKTIFRRMA